GPPRAKRIVRSATWRVEYTNAAILLPIGGWRPPVGKQYCCPMPASLELVKIALQAYGNRDSEIALALTGPHVRWDERASRAEGDLVWGHDNVERAMRRYLDGWESYSFEVEDIAEVAPGKIVGICRERGKPKEGPAVDRRFGGLWIVEAGGAGSRSTAFEPQRARRAGTGGGGGRGQGARGAAGARREARARSGARGGGRARSGSRGGGRACASARAAARS